MKKFFLILLLTLFCSHKFTYAYRITFSNENRDSVRIDFGLLDIHNRDYKVLDVQLYIDAIQYPVLNYSKTGFVDIIFPVNLLKADSGRIVLKVLHKIDKSQNAAFEIKNREVCVGFCDIAVISLKRKLINQYESGGTRTITSDELERGAY